MNKLDLIGNEELKDIINQMKKELPLPHILLYGPSGTGKSTIAKWIAEQCKTKYAVFYASNLDDFFINFTLQNIEANTILIVDEIHTLPKKLMEVFYQPMEEHILHGKKVSPFTLIGATTELYKIPEPFYRRFIIPYRVSLYKDSEIEQFIKLYSKKTITNNISTKISKLCKGNPGYARNYMEILHRISDKEINNEDVLELMNVKKIDEDGLDMQDWMYLTILRRYDVVGLNTMCSLIGEPVQTIEHKIEPYLMQLGLVIKTQKGRRLTPIGNSYIQDKE
jgi:holliday junction DNA helicase RuvB